MKKILLVLVAGLLYTIGFTQAQLENPGFEGAWETAGVSGSEPEPEDWSSLKSADALATLAPIVAFQETVDPHSGTYCIRLLVVNSFGVNANGLLTNGRVHADFNPENGYVWSETGDAQWNTPFTDRPDSLTFWVKHAPISGDQSKVMVVLHEDPPTGQLPHDGNYTHWVGQGRSDLTATYATWTRVSVPFIYYNSNTPDYVLVSLSAGDSTIALEDTEMWIDDLQLIYNPLTVSVTPPAQQNIDVGVNGTDLTVAYTTNSGVTSTPTQEWKFSTTAGGPYSSFGPTETGTIYTPNFATAGVYYVVCEVDFGIDTIISNEVEIVVVDPLVNTVTITPGATQSINENQNGNVLTASETPTAASSRDWQWSTTSGSGYASFNPVETNTTYTPNFATAGTYYVICESDFAGDIQTSNEVIVVVAPEGTGIDEENLQFNIFNNGSSVQVSYENAGANATIEMFTLDGKRIYQSILFKGTTEHEINTTQGVYIYRVVDGDMIITGKISL